MATMTTSTNAANLYLYYVKKLLSVLEPRLVLHPLGRAVSMPKGMGTQVKWLRYSRIDGYTTPLTEGTVPTEISVSTANVLANIQQYGQFAKVSDLLSMTAIDPVLKSLSERFGRGAATTIEQLIAAEIEANGFVLPANSKANEASITSTDYLTFKDLIKAMITQKQNFIPAHESGTHLVVLNAACEYDMVADNSNVGGFIDVNKYTIPGRENLLTGEIGKMYGMKVLVSDKLGTDVGGVGGSVNIRKNYVIGEEAFGVVELSGESVRMIIKPHGSAGALDPLDQFATVGYKLGGFAAKFLGTDNARRIMIVEAASTL